MEQSRFFQRLSMPDEKWKQVDGFDDYYVSTMGRVLSLKSNTPRMLKIYNKTLKGREYSYVCLCGEKQHVFRVHRLVAVAFIANPNNWNEIDHINNVGTDNRVANLRWCTHRDNIRNPLTIEKHREYALTHPFERRKGIPRNVNLSVFFNKHEDKMESVVQIKEGVVLATYKSLGEAERHGFKKTSISAALSGRLKTYRGCIWMLQSDFNNLNSSDTFTSFVPLPA